MAKRIEPVRTKKRKKAVRKRPVPVLLKPFDAKKYPGMIPAFGNITLEEMCSWR